MENQIKDGDVVYFSKFKEVFAFGESRDKMIKDKLRLATEEEKKKLQDSGKDCIEIE